MALLLPTLAATNSMLAATRPNLVYILNDDTDVMLGSPVSGALHQTRSLLADGGAEFTQFRTLSPKCTPSRAGQLVGRHYHNVRPVAAETAMVEVLEDGTTVAPQGGGLNQTTMFEPTALFPMLKAAGYWTSIVGKVHNSQGGWLCKPGHNRTDAFTHISTVCGPCGNYFPDEFVVKEVGEPTTRLVKAKDPTDYAAVYSHGQYSNRSTAFMRQAVAAGAPFFAHIGTTGPHLPSLPAPWHAARVDAWKNAATDPNATAAPRTPNFNGHYADHHPSIAALPPIDADKLHFVDEHMRDRLGTMLSIDDLVAAVVATLDELRVLERSYVLFSSDHGYHLGQWRLPMEKMWPYETDCRIPFYIRGPGIAPGTKLDVLGVNMDIAPTLLSLAGVTVPRNYDGRSLLPLLLAGAADDDEARAAAAAAAAASSWRTRTVISFAEGAFQNWGQYPFPPWPANATDPTATRHAPSSSASGGEYNFDNPSNQWRQLRVANATHNVSFVEWDPAFVFDTVAFAALWDVTADPYQQHNLWPALGEAERASWHAELDKEFACAGHHGRATDCS